MDGHMFLLVVLFVLSVGGQDRGATWTSWYNLDSPSGSGDYEMFFVAKARKLPVCNCPIGTECRERRKRLPWNTTGQTVSRHCDVAGLACVNAANVGGCFDYEVRFLCPPDEPNTYAENTQWTQWINMDTPDGNGEYEKLYLAKDMGLPVCNCPIAAECRTVLDRVPWNQTGQIIQLRCDTEGLTCLNWDNSGGCLDYEVRYLCPSDSVSRRHEVTATDRPRSTSGDNRIDITTTRDNEAVRVATSPRVFMDTSVIATRSSGVACSIFQRGRYHYCPFSCCGVFGSQYCCIRRHSNSHSHDHRFVGHSMTAGTIAGIVTGSLVFAVIIAGIAFVRSGIASRFCKALRVTTTKTTGVRTIAESQQMYHIGQKDPLSSAPPPNYDDIVGLGYPATSAEKKAPRRTPSPNSTHRQYQHAPATTRAAHERGPTTESPPPYPGI